MKIRLKIPSRVYYAKILNIVSVDSMSGKVTGKIRTIASIFSKIRCGRTKGPSNKDEMQK